MSEPTEEEIQKRLAERPDLVDRLKGGDSAALAELMEATLDTTVVRTTVRTLA